MVRSLPPLELWAGIECTHNRVGDRRFDQLARTGHRERVEDLDLIHALGIPALRYPILWEHVAGGAGGQKDWSWSDERLGRLRELGIRPVVGLLHHGAGPGEDGFEDPSFPARFAAYARSVAERYPWVRDYIPINEPLTTARFAGLYGVWHPHARDGHVFARILLAQLRATVLAMRAIRSIVPEACLIQNEDLGTIQAVPSLRYEADFQNERRWVTFDLLCGGLRPGMVMWDWLRSFGVSEDELTWFYENAAPPDLIACDNYITSDRLLDDRMDRYPAWSHGGNGRDRYADIESVRATRNEPPGILPLLREAWQRYGRPLAIGETHIGCTREEQLRWLRDAWGAAETARREGADVRAVTVWSLFGAYDWNTLVTEENGYYEPGAFDVRDGRPRATAAAAWIRATASAEPFDHPVLDREGWWRRPERLMYPPVEVSDRPFVEPRLRTELPDRPRRLAIVGAAGALLDASLRIAAVRGLPTFRPRALRDRDLEAELEDGRAWAVVDIASCATTGNGAPDGGPARTSIVARACARLGLPLMAVSCQHLMGAGRGPCARRALSREAAAREGHDRPLVIRTGTLFGPWDARDPLVGALRGAPVPPSSAAMAVAYVPDVVNAALDLLVDDEDGTWHIGHDARVTWPGLANAARTLAAGRIPEQLGTGPPLVAGRMHRLPTLLDALSRFVVESEPLWLDEGAPARAEVVELDSGPAYGFPADEPTATLAGSPEKQAG